MHDQHPTGTPDPLVAADRLLNEAWHALSEYRDTLDGQQAELVSALLGALTVLQYPLGFILGR